MSVLIFSATFVWNISNSKTNQRDIITNDIGRHAQYRYSCHILTKLEFSRYIFEK